MPERDPLAEALEAVKYSMLYSGKAWRAKAAEGERVLVAALAELVELRAQHAVLVERAAEETPEELQLRGYPPSGSLAYWRERAVALQDELTAHKAVAHTALDNSQREVVALRALVERAERQGRALADAGAEFGKYEAAIETLQGQVAALRETLVDCATAIGPPELYAAGDDSGMAELARRLRAALAGEEGAGGDGA